MNTNATLLSSRFSTAFLTNLSTDEIRRRAPAAFAGSAHERTSGKYTFIPTSRILEGLIHAGFICVAANQTQARHSVEHTRHVLRFRRRFETIQMRDSIPEVAFYNSHDGTSAYLMLIWICHL